MSTLNIYTDNAGGITLQTRNYCHHYQDPKQAADDALKIVRRVSTAHWEGNEPEHRVTDSTGYRHVTASNLGDLRAAAAELVGHGHAETEFAARVLGAAVLKIETEATCVHGTTGQDVSEDTLARALTLVRKIETEETEDGKQTTFLASTDGRQWYQYRTFDAVEVRS